LLANALKSRQAGTAIGVHLRPEKPDRLILAVTYSAISVEDQVLRNLLPEPRTSDATRNQSDISELGLELVQECSTLLGGTLSAKTDGPHVTITVDVRAPLMEVIALLGPAAPSMPPQQAQEATAPHFSVAASSRQVPGF